MPLTKMNDRSVRRASSPRIASLLMGVGVLAAAAPAPAVDFTPVHKLIGKDAVGSAFQGSSVALSADGSTAIVGGINDATAGAAWVYTRT